MFKDFGNNCLIIINICKLQTMKRLNFSGRRLQRDIKRSVDDRQQKNEAFNDGRIKVGHADFL